MKRSAPEDRMMEEFVVIPMEECFVVIPTGAEQEECWLYHEERALEYAKKLARVGHEVRVYKLTETYYFAGRGANEDAGQSS